jgi:hypothetical protein
MNPTPELQKLAQLHEQGELSDEEFVAAKRRLLESPVLPRTLDAPPPVGRDDHTVRTYFSSRWSSGNFFFRDRLTIGADGITFRKGSLFGSNEEHISYHAIASFKVDHGVFLSNLTVETSGGSQPVFINGLWKGQAREVQALLTEQGKR